MLTHKVMIMSRDLALCHQLLTLFEADGYRVFTVGSRTETHCILQRGTVPHMVLFDIDPAFGSVENELTYFQFLSDTQNLPILLVNVMSDMDRLCLTAETLNADFMPKSAHESEWRLRVARLLNSNPDRDPDGLLFDLGNNVRADVGNRTIFHGREMIVFSSLENKLLTMLVQNPQCTVPSERLANTLWKEMGDHQNKLRGVVRRLRQKLTPILGDGCIETVAGVGYGITCPVTAVESQPDFTFPTGLKGGMNPRLQTVKDTVWQ